MSFFVNKKENLLQRTFRIMKISISKIIFRKIYFFGNLKKRNLKLIVEIS